MCVAFVRAGRQQFSRLTSKHNYTIKYCSLSLHACLKHSNRTLIWMDCNWRDTHFFLLHRLTGRVSETLEPACTSLTCFAGSPHDCSVSSLPPLAFHQPEVVTSVNIGPLLAVILQTNSAAGCLLTFNTLFAQWSSVKLKDVGSMFAHAVWEEFYSSSPLALTQLFFLCLEVMVRSWVLVWLEL